MTSNISKYKRIPLIIAFQEVSQYKDTYAGEIGTVALTAHLLKTDNSENKTAVVVTSPVIRKDMSILLRQHIEDVVVNKQHRGKQIGKQLLLWACEYAKQQNCYKVILNCKVSSI